MESSQKISTLLFPFTYLEPQHLEHFYRVCHPLTLYQAHSSLIPDALLKEPHTNRLSFLFPRFEDENELTVMYHQHQDWIKSQSRLKDKPPLKTLSDEIPFFTETSLGAIRSQISASRTQNTAPRKNHLIRALLFLLHAQDYDTQSAEIALRLSAINHMESQMLDRLTGNDAGESIDPFEPLSERPEDPGRMLPHQRLTAWSTVFLHHLPGAKLVPELFLTPSRAILEEMLENLPESLVQVIPQADTDPAMTFYEIQESPFSLFARFGVAPHSAPPHGNMLDGTILNCSKTLVGLWT